MNLVLAYCDAYGCASRLYVKIHDLKIILSCYSLDSSSVITEALKTYTHVRPTLNTSDV